MRVPPTIAALLLVLLPGVAAVAQGLSDPREQAAFLAGLPLPGSSPLRRLQLSPEYRAHQQELRKQWEFCRQARYEAMRRWGAEHLARYPVTRGVLRYLFGGPDFLNAYAFFPDTRVMVLGGLEPVGEVPPPEALSPAALGPALQSLDEALHTSLFAGYFITTEMKPQLAQGAFRGVLPVLYTELALTGNIIDSVSMERPFGSPGVRILYHRPGGGAQTLWYFQANLSNGRECRNFVSWLGELGPGASYLKAASYLLPLGDFSETRNFLIRTSELVLQDDSGLPYRCFLPGVWRLSLYGVYTDPLPIFKLRRDPALAEAYDSPLRGAPLPFGAGYHVRADDANLLLAVRENEALGQSLTASTAPPAVPAFTTPSPTPRPRKVRIRKALPVPIRKAIPVASPMPTPVPAATPVEIPQPVTATPTVPAPMVEAPAPSASAMPVVPVPSEQPAVNPPTPSVDSTADVPSTSPEPPVQQTPVTVPTVEGTAVPAPVQESPVPLTGEGKPID